EIRLCYVKNLAESFSLKFNYSSLSLQRATGSVDSGVSVRIFGAASSLTLSSFLAEIGACTSSFIINVIN
ncbi:MAG: hypothetical protein ACTHVZ_08925, partial [Ruoffia tabacinasalis]